MIQQHKMFEVTKAVEVAEVLKWLLLTTHKLPKLLVLQLTRYLTHGFLKRSLVELTQRRLWCRHRQRRLQKQCFHQRFRHHQHLL